MRVVSHFQFGLPRNGPDKRHAHENSINALHAVGLLHIGLDLNNLYPQNDDVNKS